MQIIIICMHGESVTVEHRETTFIIIITAIIVGLNSNIAL